MADPDYIDDTGALVEGEAWVALLSTTVTGSPANVTFTSTNDGQVGDWSQYLDLFVVYYMRSGASSGGFTYMTLNGDSSSKYNNVYMQSPGTSPSGGVSGVNEPGAWISREILSGDLTNAFACGLIHFFDINSGKYKEILSYNANDFGSGTSSWWATYGNTYRSNAPITTMTIPPYGGTGWAVGSRFDLFGVLPRMAQ